MLDERATRHLLRRWHSALVVASVEGSRRAAHSSAAYARARTHAHAIGLLANHRRVLHDRRLRLTLHSWKERANALEHAATMSHQRMRATHDRARGRPSSAYDYSGISQREWRESLPAEDDERDAAWRQRLASTHAAFHERFKRSRASMAAEQRALAHCCAATLVQSCLAHRTLALAQLCFVRWREAVEGGAVAAAALLLRVHQHRSGGTPYRPASHPASRPASRASERSNDQYDDAQEWPSEGSAGTLGALGSAARATPTRDLLDGSPRSPSRWGALGQQLSALTGRAGASPRI